MHICHREEAIRSIEWVTWRSPSYVTGRLLRFARNDTLRLKCISVIARRPFVLLKGRRGDRLLSKRAAFVRERRLLRVGFKKRTLTRNDNLRCDCPGCVHPADQGLFIPWYNQSVYRGNYKYWAIFAGTTRVRSSLMEKLL